MAFNFNDLPLEDESDVKVFDFESLPTEDDISPTIPKDISLDETPTEVVSVPSKLKEFDFPKAFESGKKELVGIKNDALKLIQSTPELTRGVTSAYYSLKYGDDKTKEETSKQIRDGAIDLSKGIKESVVDAGKTFGVDFNNPDNKLSLDTAINKWENAPIESVLDATLLSSVVKPVSKSLFKSTVNAATRDKQRLAQKIISKDDIETKQILKNVGNKEVNDLLDDLYEESSIINKMDISTQLNNPNFSKEIGRQAALNIKRLKKRDQIRLNTAIKKIKDVDIDKTVLGDDLGDRLRAKGLVSEGNVLDIDNLETGISKKALEKEINVINDLKPMSAGQLKLRMDSLDDKINWKTPKTADIGLIEARRVYRNQLRNLSGDYDDTARLVSEKLDNFEPQLKRIEKVGGGEKLGKNLFPTDDELNEFISLMDKTPDKLAGSIKGDLKTLKAWHSWNKYFKQNPDFIIGDIPGISPKVIPDVKKKIIKGDIAIGSPRASSLFKKSKRKTINLGSRSLLEGADIKEREGEI